MGSGSATRAPALTPEPTKVPRDVRGLSPPLLACIVAFLDISQPRAASWYFLQPMLCKRYSSCLEQLMPLLTEARPSLLARAVSCFQRGFSVAMSSAFHGLCFALAFWQRLHRLQRLQPRLQDSGSLHSLNSTGPSFGHFVALRIGLLPRGRAASEGGYPLGGACSGDGSSCNGVYGRYRLSSSAVRLRGGGDQPDEPRKGDLLGPRQLVMGSRMQLCGLVGRAELNGCQAVDPTRIMRCIRTRIHHQSRIQRRTR